MNSPTTAPSAKPALRKKYLTGLAAVVALGGLAWAGYSYWIASHHESTDNAYVQGQVVQVTPQISGTVQAILADDTDFVKAGQLLVQLDPADARIALDQAEASLAQAVRQARTLYTNNGGLSAQISVREADVLRAQGDVSRATQDLSRRQSLTGNGAVSSEELDHAQAQLATARSQLAAAQGALATAREQLQSNQALTEGTAVGQHPSVQLAAAKVREAFLATQRTQLLAPVEGYVAKRTVQLGQRVAAGAPLMSVIPLRQVWVEANFKEPQLRRIRIGQPVKLVADVYGSQVEFRGTVLGLGAGTGAAFALLPAQNATGNWIKVVQRVPVRIALDPAQLDAHPLRVGLSMQADVEVSQQDGKALADTAAVQLPAAPVRNDAAEASQAEVQRVIAANVGVRTGAMPSHAATAAVAAAAH